MKYVIDIDGTICSQEADYEKAEPIKKRIEYFNSLYNFGNEIIYFTARGTDTEISWESVTKKQLKDWGVLYHKLLFGKPSADIYIDDKAINASRVDC